MPEIWVPYGAVEVAIDIRAENLLEVVEKPKLALTDEEIKQRLAQLNLSDKIAILLADDEEPSLRAARILGSLLVEKNIQQADVQFIASRKSVNLVRKRLEGLPFRISTATGEGKIMEEVYGNADTRILLSQVGLDGLFGFAGGLVSLARALESRAVGESFLAHPPHQPAPGTNTEASKMLWETARHMTGTQSLEIVPSCDDIADLIVGDIQSAQKSAEEKFLATSTKSMTGKTRAVILSPGNKRADATLSSSVRSLWNILEGLKERSTVAILSECNGGLGSEAFRLYGIGKLDITNISRSSKYVEGLEDLIFLREVSKMHQIVLVSTLPNYYVETRFNLKSRKKSGDALNYLLSSQGQRTRVLVVPQASETLLKS